MKRKFRIIELKRFGKIEETISYNLKNSFWKSKYGDDLLEPRESSIIISVVFDKKDYPNKDNLPKFKYLEARWKK